jgi:cyclohexyl-isocyanide hydratase
MANDNPASHIRVGIPLYPNFDALDVVGPHQTFSMQGSMKTWLIGPSTCEPVPSFEGVQIIPDQEFDSCPQLDVLFVPGGLNFSDSLLNQDFLGFLRQQAAGATLVTSVCTGALFLAAAGLLDGYKATTHWGYKSVLRLFPRVIVAEGFPRFVIDANRVTGGGISSGLDQAMAIVSLLLGDDAAKRGQLTMQYAPQPPFNNGDPSTADPSILYQVSSGLRKSIDELTKTVEELLSHPSADRKQSVER